MVQSATEVRVTTPTYGPRLEGCDEDAIVNNVRYALAANVHGPGAWIPHPTDPDSTFMFLAGTEAGPHGSIDWHRGRSDVDGPGGWAMTRSATYLHRNDYKEPSAAALNKAEAIIVEAVAAWAATDEAPIILARAQVARAKSNLEREERALVEADNARTAAHDIYRAAHETHRVAEAELRNMAKHGNKEGAVR
jgi:hypothetical protein